MENTIKSYKNNKRNISAPPMNEEFELPDWSCCILDIQDVFENILKNMEKTPLINTNKNIWKKIK